MARPNKLTEIQKERLARLEPQLKLAVLEKNFENAKRIVSDIQDFLRPSGHITRLVQVKNTLFELAIEIGLYDYAEQGFIGNRKLVNKNTRLYLEATALLAICHLRKSEYEKAKPYIQEVLKNENIIKSEKTRRNFHHGVIERFDEEAALFSLKFERNEKLDIDEIQREAGILLSSSTEDGIYLILGKSLPKQTKDILFQIDDFAKNQLSSAERKMLASPKELVKDEIAGKTVFQSLKRVIYKSLCDPNSEVYKAWYNNGLGVVLNKKYITSAIVVSLTGLGIGFSALAISAVALILRFGLDVYCEHNKPIGIMEIRTK
jgi:tetratricopeptide (TPR) repeat protein